jgi:hypothetical protein
VTKACYRASTESRELSFCELLFPPFLNFKKLPIGLLGLGRPASSLFTVQCIIRKQFVQYITLHFTVKSHVTYQLQFLGGKIPVIAKDFWVICLFLGSAKKADHAVENTEFRHIWEYFVPAFFMVQSA